MKLETEWSRNCSSGYVNKIDETRTRLFLVRGLFIVEAVVDKGLRTSMYIEK